MVALFAALAILGPDVAAARPARAACVLIRVANGEREGSGTVVGVRRGFAYVLTASHVLGGSKEAEVRFSTKDEVGSGNILFDEPHQDLALVRVAASEKVEAVSIAGFSPPEEDEDFDAVSAGARLEGVRVRFERVVAKRLLRRRADAESFVWEVRERSTPGQSGGPLLDRRARLIGICLGNQGGKGYYCHQDEIIFLLKKHEHAWLVPGNGNE